MHVKFNSLLALNIEDIIELQIRRGGGFTQLKPEHGEPFLSACREALTMAFSYDSALQTHLRPYYSERYNYVRVYSGAEYNTPSKTSYALYLRAGFKWPELQRKEADKLLPAEQGSGADGEVRANIGTLSARVFHAFYGIFKSCHLIRTEADTVYDVDLSEFGYISVLRTAYDLQKSGGMIHYVYQNDGTGVTVSFEADGNKYEISIEYTRPMSTWETLFIEAQMMPDTVALADLNYAVAEELAAAMASLARGKYKEVAPQAPTYTGALAVLEIAGEHQVAFIATDGVNHFKQEIRPFEGAVYRPIDLGGQLVRLIPFGWAGEPSPRDAYLAHRDDIDYLGQLISQELKELRRH